MDRLENLPKLETTNNPDNSSFKQSEKIQKIFDERKKKFEDLGSKKEKKIIKLNTGAISSKKSKEEEEEIKISKSHYGNVKINLENFDLNNVFQIAEAMPKEIIPFMLKNVIFSGNLQHKTEEECIRQFSKDERFYSFVILQRSVSQKTFSKSLLKNWCNSPVYGDNNCGFHCILKWIVTNNQKNTEYMKEIVWKSYNFLMSMLNECGENYDAILEYFNLGKSLLLNIPSTIDKLNSYSSIYIKAIAAFFRIIVMYMHNEGKSNMAMEELKDVLLGDMVTPNVIYQLGKFLGYEVNIVEVKGHDEIIPQCGNIAANQGNVINDINLNDFLYLIAIKNCHFNFLSIKEIDQPINQLELIKSDYDPSKLKEIKTINCKNEMLLNRYFEMVFNYYKQGKLSTKEGVFIIEAVEPLIAFINKNQKRKLSRKMIENIAKEVRKRLIDKKIALTNLDNTGQRLSNILTALVTMSVKNKLQLGSINSLLELYNIEDRRQKVLDILKIIGITIIDSNENLNPLEATEMDLQHSILELIKESMTEEEVLSQLIGFNMISYDEDTLEYVRATYNAIKIACDRGELS